jgi:autotransporter-associated beta strand protein
MRIKRRFHRAGCLGLLPLALLTLDSAGAESATWNLSPASGDWETAANWSPAIVPNGPTDVATFSASAIDAITFSRPRGTTTVNSIVFDPNASPFSIAAGPNRFLDLVGAGVINQSAAVQALISHADSSGHGTIVFSGRATAGTMTLYTASGTNASASAGGTVEFHDKATASTATFVLTAGTASLADGGQVDFFDNSTADEATFTNKGGAAFGGFGSFGGATVFFDTTHAGEATITNNGDNGAPGQTVFAGNSRADHATFINNPATHGDGGITLFEDTSDAGSSSSMNNGATVSGGVGGRSFFNSSASAGSAIFVNQGAVGVTTLFAGARTEFVDSATAAKSTITADGGTDGGVGAVINFAGDSDGGTARLIVLDNGNLQAGLHNSPGATIGSLEGDGLVFLGGQQLSVGNTTLNTTFSGVIQDGGEQGGTGGSILKLGTRTLTLTGANTYTGGTTVTSGTLIVSNATGSGTGTATVEVNGGTLGGSGTIAGAVTVGTGSGSGAALIPSAGSRRRTSLRLQSSLILKADATYSCRLYLQGGKSDQVIARGVTIEAGASLTFLEPTSGSVAPGAVLTLIQNSGTTPIAGTFSNLADGAIVTEGGNNFQVSYEGGSGNDLTLTAL